MIADALPIASTIACTAVAAWALTVTRERERAATDRDALVARHDAREAQLLDDLDHAVATITDQNAEVVTLVGERADLRRALADATDELDFRRLRDDVLNREPVAAARRRHPSTRGLHLVGGDAS